MYGPDYAALTVTVDFETNERVHVKIAPTGVARWEVPEFIFPRPTVTTRAANPTYNVTYTASPFSFAVARRDTGDVLFDTSESASEADLFKSLIFEEQYMEISTRLPDNAAIYGLGERVRALRLAEGISYTMWNADEATPQNQNVYGAHPYYVELRNGRAHGVVRPCRRVAADGARPKLCERTPWAWPQLLMNGNGMDVTLSDRHLTYQVIGGVLDFYIFLVRCCATHKNPECLPFY